MQKKKILLTGATGYIGSHVWVELLAHGYEVVGVDNFSNSKPDVIKRVEKISRGAVNFEEADISKDQISLMFDRYNFNAVIHLAAYKVIPDSLSNPLEYYSNNCNGLLELLACMVDKKCLEMIYSSSASVYGNSASSPVQEEDSLAPNNPYARTKLMGEQILFDVAAANSNFKYAALRYFNPVAAHHSGILGEPITQGASNIMPAICAAALYGTKLKIYGGNWDTEDGTPVRDFIHIIDLAKAHVQALKYLDGHSSDVFNVGTGCGVSVLNLIKSFEKVNNVLIDYETVDRRDGDIGISYASANKINKKMTWSSSKTLEDMCRDSWQWYSSQGNMTK